MTATLTHLMKRVRETYSLLFRDSHREKLSVKKLTTHREKGKLGKIGVGIKVICFEKFSLFLH